MTDFLKSLLNDLAQAKTVTEPVKMTGGWFTNADPKELTATPDGRGYTVRDAFGGSVTYPDAVLGAPRSANQDQNARADEIALSTMLPSEPRGANAKALEKHGYVGIYQPR